MMSNFETYLLGLYNNKRQAQSYPTEYSQVFILWEKIDGGYHSKQWYRRDGHEKPYREKYHKLVEVSETEVIMQNYHLDWTRHEDCDMIFTYDGKRWHGKLIGDNCTAKGYKVVAEIHLTGPGLESRDKGLDENGKLMWGSLGLFKFVRS
jgi:hypothetical protein